MPQTLGAHNPRIELARDLLKKKGRRANGLFSFEGPTLLDEALRSGVAIESVFATKQAFEKSEAAKTLEVSGVPVYIVGDNTFSRISDVDNPTGLLAIAPLQISPLDEVLRDPGLVLILADLSDPGNAGTLLRSAEAFGVTRVVFGTLGVEPRHPKVVRAAMGSGFRLEIALAGPEQVQTIAQGADWQGIGLAADAPPLAEAVLPTRAMLVVGNERAGLGPWEAICATKRSIPMAGPTDSLNAAIAGSIALYEASKRR
ncbi:MAG: RNA methyltransferase [Candidatus Eremiobacteraeota bacterium]|nr:RNA methyltransferase [Candidatus Eremiobacteraeota bacterium]